MILRAPVCGHANAFPPRLQRMEMADMVRVLVEGYLS
jgi:hypothetical protein